MGREGFSLFLFMGVVVQVGTADLIPPLPTGRRSISGPYQRTFQVFQGRHNQLWKRHRLGTLGMPGKKNRTKRPGLSWEKGAHLL